VSEWRCRAATRRGRVRPHPREDETAERQLHLDALVLLEGVQPLPGALLVEGFVFGPAHAPATTAGATQVRLLGRDHRIQLLRRQGAVPGSHLPPARRDRVSPTLGQSKLGRPIAVHSRAQ
jgi:hypothetical protein